MVRNAIRGPAIPAAALLGALVAVAVAIVLGLLVTLAVIGQLLAGAIQHYIVVGSASGITRTTMP